jgi:hypothetical protein
VITITFERNSGHIFVVAHLLGLNWLARGGSQVLLPL